jgi:Flp pilus assembly pilin Flp
MSKLISLFRNEEGMQHAEEALLLALVAVAAVAILGTLSGAINGVFTAASGAMVVP